MSTDSDLQQLALKVAAFAEARDWSQFHDPKNLVMALSSEVGELSALFRWVPNAEADAVARGEPTRGSLADEIGDVGILLLLLCDRVGVELRDAIHEKLERNEQRYPVELSLGKSERPQRQDRFERILDALNSAHRRATYGAVAALVDRPAAFLMSGRPKNPRHSWVVNRESGLPTGYEQHEMHSALLSHTEILSSAQDLASWLGDAE